jgi:NCS1 family nucleobase:cation symporter-1
MLGLNIIDWASFIVAIIFQTMIFSVGINLNKKIINYSAIAVYSGMILFFLSIFLNDIKLTSQAFIDILNYKNFLNLNNIIPLLTVAGTIFAYFSIIIISLGDFTRYIKNKIRFSNKVKFPFFKFLSFLI